MPTKRHDVVTLAFVITAILFTAYIIGPALNYAEFYQSIEEIDLLVSRISFIQESDNPLTVAITTNFTIVYPASYSGLRFRSLQITRARALWVSSGGGNQTISVSGEQYFYNYIPLNPGSNMTVQTIHREVGTPAAYALAPLQDVQTQLVWNLECRTLFNAFLESPVDLNFDVSYP